MSFREVLDCIESHARIEKRELKQNLTLKHFLAKDIAQYIGRMFDSRVSSPLELWDFFPGLFEEEREEVEEEQRSRELAIYKAKMQDFTFRHNKKLSRTGGE